MDPTQLTKLAESFGWQVAVIIFVIVGMGSIIIFFIKTYMKQSADREAVMREEIHVARTEMKEVQAYVRNELMKVNQTMAQVAQQSNAAMAANTKVTEKLIEVLQERKCMAAINLHKEVVEK